MAKLPGSFNSNEHDDMGTFSVIDDGEYVMQITESDLVPTKAAAEEKGGNVDLDPEAYSGLRLNMTAVVMSGQDEGHKVFIGLNVKNPSAKAVEISQKELATICRAVGKVAIQDSSELHGIPFVGVVGTQPANGQYAAKNIMVGYKPYTGAPLKSRNEASPGSAIAKAGKVNKGEKKKLWD